MGLGALLSPLIADPFLSEDSCLLANSTANITSGSHLFHASRVLGQQHMEARPWSNQTHSGPSPQIGAGTRVSYAFWIMALINVSAPRAGPGGHQWTVTRTSPYLVQNLLILWAGPRCVLGEGSGGENSSLRSFDCDILGWRCSRE